MTSPIRLQIFILLALSGITHAAISLNEAGGLPAGESGPLVQEALAADRPVEGPAAAANQAFSEGRFDEAVKLARPLADQGNADALFLLGLAHESAQGVEASRDKALEYYRKASAKGHQDAGYRTSLILLLSDKEAERNEARKALEKAALTDVALAGRILGEAWLRGLLSEEPDPNKAMDWWQRAAAAEDLPSIRLLTSLFEGQFGFPEFVDSAKALKLYEQAATLGDVSSMVDLGSRLLNGDEKLRDEKRGREWLNKAMDLGNFTACLVLGDYEENVKKDDKAALKIYERGKDGGQIDCLLRAADYHLQGRGTDKDPSRGQALLLEAAKAGHPQAQFRIAMAILAGEKPDLGAAYLNLLSAANQQMPAAQNELGLFYLSGKMGVADPAAATSWLTRAAKLGHPAAQHNLATLYEAGAAGLPQDHKNAGELYGLAAKQGHVQAILALARIYSTGGPVEADLPKAWALASLAVEKNEESAVQMRDKLAEQLDETQLKQAKKILEEFKRPATEQ